ncbi:MAG: DUF6781 family protein, partial [Thermodesulfobacteriota bacterium]|nr:DUF6781 family protein [Thermodesulfobacteriota bacterium]
VEGAIDGIKSTEQRAMDRTRQEIQQLKTRLNGEKQKQSEDVREALEGTRQSGEAFTGETKEHIETAVTDTKLKYAELLGLTRETVKQAVKRVIDRGKDIEETVAQITRDATEKALAEAHFSADRTRKVSHAVISAAVETAEEANTNISEVARGAVQGTREGITSAVESTKETLSAASAKTKSFATEDLAQTKEDLEAVGDLFLETVRGVAGKSGKVAGDVLTEIADQARKTPSTLMEKAGEAAETVSNRLKELGQDTFGKAAHLTEETVHTAADEARQLSKRALDIARGAVSGILKGAKHALRKDKEDKS